MAGAMSGDRRVRRTRRLLRDALVSLVHEKHYASIAVREILERANVGRSAFYAHFDGKDDLMAHGIRAMLHESAPRRRATSGDKLVWFSLPVLDFVSRVRDNAATHMDDADRAAVHERLAYVLREEIARDVESLRGKKLASPAIPPELVADYVVSTFIVVLRWWVETGSQLGPADVDAMFRALVAPTLAKLVAGTPD
jgi:AcrR family transcriptional regulator